MKARLRLEIRGAVQGVGFRPFVYRLARELDLDGHVLNSGRGVEIEVEGPRAAVRRFHERLPREKPPLAILHSVAHRWLEPSGGTGFRIRRSDEAGEKSAVVLPDVATCGDCLAETRDPSQRRFRYPFTNCTNCGPRLTIVEALPYDRPHTTMRGFPMCDDCRREYEDPLDRRFHAQPIACPRCGPRLTFEDRDGKSVATGDGALLAAAAAIRSGRIVAVKGLGGFHLLVDARDHGAVEELRRRKGRYGKPLALMVRDVDAARDLVEVPAAAAELLGSYQAPIVLLRRRAGIAIAEGVAPGLPELGVMLPYTPLHHVLLAELGFPIVATSGNLSDEPIAVGNDEAHARLGEIADAFLVHDRPIARHVDDSVLVLMDGEPAFLRRARGYAPVPVVLKRTLPSILAVGAHLKNTIALSVDDKIFLSQHLGDLETAEAMRAFERVIADFLALYEAKPVAIAHDLHPDYLSTRWARETPLERLQGLPLVGVQHHHAHLAACLADHDAERALGVTWDGTGYGTDGTVWGGEVLLGTAASFERVATLRPFRLPGGDAAVREPRRAALALLWEMGGDAVLDRHDLAPIAALEPGVRRPLVRMMERGINAPPTTSMGRLFDAVASLVGLRQRVSFEGEAAMMLEAAARRAAPMEDAYPLPWIEGPSGAGRAGAGAGVRLDWGPLVEAVIEDVGRGIDVAEVAVRFHNALVEAVVDLARTVGEPTVALTGGCFQNRLLTEKTARRLRGEGFTVLLHRRVPPNDGSISLGQVAVAAAAIG